MTVCDQFIDAAHRVPDSTLIHHLGEDYSYDWIATRAENMARGLQELGLKHGDRVGILLENRAEYAVAYFAVQLAGGIVVALNPATTRRELEHTLVHAAPRIVIYLDKSRDALQTVVPQLSDLIGFVPVGKASIGGTTNSVSFTALTQSAGTHKLNSPRLDRIAQIIYTSGTTGHPKGVSLTHSNLASNTKAIAQCLRLTQSDSVFVVLPFYYSYGNSLLLTHATVGGRLVIASDFVFWNRAMNLMRDQNATGFCGVPSTFAMLLNHSNFASMEFPDLRYLACAGGALAPSMIQRLRQCLSKTQIYVMYGQTEATARLSILDPADLPEKAGSVGRGIPGVRLRVLDESRTPTLPGEVGELFAKGDNIMHGYWNDDAETQKVLSDDGLRTGDLARMDEDGFVYIVGRRSDLIKTGANRVNPEEIEEVILELAGIAEVAVTGEPDELLGEAIVAYVVATNEAISGERILEHCKVQLPPHKRVRRIEFVQALPKTSSGKVRRGELRSRNTLNTK